MRPCAFVRRIGAKFVLLFVVLSLLLLSIIPTAVTTVSAGGRDCGGTVGDSLPQQPVAALQMAGSAAALPSLAQSAESKSWAGQADFLPGAFESTEIVTSTRYIALNRAWSANFPIGPVGGPVTQDQPSLAALGDNLYGAWRLTRSGNGDIRAGRIDTTFGGVQVNDDTNSAQQDQPRLASRGVSGLHLLWHDTRRDEGDIYASASTDSGASWSANVRVNDDSGTALQRSPSVITGTVGICSCWFDKRRGHGDIYFSSSSDGLNWAPNKPINDDAGTAEQDAPQMARSSQAIHAVWQDARNGTWDIYSSRTDQNGENWQPKPRRR